MQKSLIISVVAGLLLGFAAFYYLFERNRSIDYVGADPQTSPTQTPSTTPKQTTLLFAGDIMLSRKVGEKIVASGDWRYPFLLIGDFLREADLTFANLENPVSNRGVRVGSIYSFRADPRTLEGLRYAGIDVVSLANNHIWDYAREAFMDTMTHLREYGIEYVGAGENFAEAHRGVTKEVNGVRITYLAYTDLISRQVAATDTTAGVSFLNRQQIIKDIQTAEAYSDLIIVSYHIGDEYQTKHNANQEVLFKEAIDAGADLIIGHHPHVVQEVEPYKHGWIAYSLGNFIFDQYFSKETMEGLVLKVTLYGKTITSVESVRIGISLNSQAYLK